MRILHKICILSMAAVLTCSLGVYAAGATDAEQGGISLPAAEVSEAVETSLPTAGENEQRMSDPEQASVTEVAQKVTTSSPPVRKISVTANAIKLDGSAVKPAGYNINDENYFKLRDIAYLMSGKTAKFSVGWNASTSSITLTTGTAYEKVGGEMSGVSSRPTIRESNARVVVDGQAVSMIAYNIDGNNYFRLRDIGAKLGFSVDYDAESRSVLLESAEPVLQSYTVTYNMNGHGTQIAPKQDVGESSKISAPAAPTSSGYVFGGWYKDSGCKTVWDFSKETVTSDVTLYAKWTKTYSVSFDMNGHGAQITPKAGVSEGSTISAPAEPTATGYVFGGWYTDSACTTVWDFSTSKVSQDATLYAKWIKTYTMTFDMNGHGSQISAKTGIAAGSKISAPADPTADGYVFGGWYIERGCYTPWVFNTDTLSSDITIYAMWTARGDAADNQDTDTDSSDGSDSNKARIDGVMTILLDSGHGGADSGEVGNGMQEKVVNLSVAQKLQALLNAAGAKVVMTVDDLSTNLKGTDRIAFVRKKMQQYNFDLSVSIHHNGGGGFGAEVFVQNETQDPTGASRDLGNLIMEEYQKLGQSSRGVKTQNLYMVRVPSEYGVPGILSEFCFLDNASDAAKIDSVEEQQAEAQAIYNAIMEYFTTHQY